MANKIKKSISNITKYKEYKKLFLFKKNKGINSILFCTNDLPDEWLIDIITFQTNSGNITEDIMITKKELEQHLEYYRNNGYSEI